MHQLRKFYQLDYFQIQITIFPRNKTAEALLLSSKLFYFQVRTRGKRKEPTKQDADFHYFQYDRRIRSHTVCCHFTVQASIVYRQNVKTFFLVTSAGYATSLSDIRTKIDGCQTGF